MSEPVLMHKLSDAELNQVAEEMATNFERMWEAKDGDVIAAMVECGCPQSHAVQQLKMHGLAVFARQFYLDYVDGKMGNPAAQIRVQKVKEAWARLSERRVVS